MRFKEFSQPVREEYVGMMSPVGSNVRKEKRKRVTPKQKVEDLSEVTRRDFIKGMAALAGGAASKTASAGLFGPSIPDPGKYEGFGSMSYDNGSRPPIDRARIELLIRSGDWAQAKVFFYVKNPFKGEIEERYVEIAQNTLQRKTNMLFMSDSSKSLIINVDNNAFRFEQALDGYKRVIIGKIK